MMCRSGQFFFRQVLLSDRDKYPEYDAVAFIFNTDLPMMQFHQHLREVQSHARTGIGVIWVDLDKAVEDPVDVCIFDPTA